MAASVTWGHGRSAQPKAPPTNGDTTRTLSTGMSKTAAISSRTLPTHWVLSHTVSISSCHRATVTGSSIGTWLSRGMTYSATTRTGAIASAASGSPRRVSPGWPASALRGPGRTAVRSASWKAVTARSSSHVTRTSEAACEACSNESATTRATG